MKATLHKDINKQDPWLIGLCEEYNDNYGRGWKRILAAELGIHESNIQNWLRSGKVPAAIKSLVAKNDEIEDLKKELLAYKDPVIIVDNNDNTYSVKLFDPETGLFRPPDHSLNNAHRMATVLSGKLDKLILEVVDDLYLEDRFDHPDDIKKIDNLVNWDKITSREKLIIESKKAQKDKLEVDEILSDLNKNGRT